MKEYKLGELMILRNKTTDYVPAFEKLEDPRFDSGERWRCSGYLGKGEIFILLDVTEDPWPGSDERSYLVQCTTTGVKGWVSAEWLEILK